MNIYDIELFLQLFPAVFSELPILVLRVTKTKTHKEPLIYNLDMTNT